MKCKICGGNLFYAHQVCRMEVIVDGDNDFYSSASNNPESDIYDSGNPYGPYTCLKCGAEYYELDGRNPSDTVDATYVTSWDEGNRLIETNCKISRKTRRVFDIETVEADDVEHLDREFVRTQDGLEYPVVEKKDFKIGINPSVFWRD